MSIHQTRTFFEKSGCGTLIMAAFGLALIIGFLLTGQMRQPEREQAAPQTPVATVGKESISLQGVEQLYEQQTKSAQEALSPMAEADTYARIVRFFVWNAVQTQLAKNAGVAVTDEKVREGFEKMLAAQADQQLAQAKMSFTLQGLIKSNASEADFASAFKGQTQKSPSEWKDELIKSQLQQFDEPGQRATATAQYVGQELLAKYEAEVKLTDEDLKKSYDKFVFKRIYVKAADKDPKDPENSQKLAVEKLEQAIAALQGGASFESAMDKFSDDPIPAGKKKKSEETVKFQRWELNNDRNLSALLTMKPGEVSGVINAEGSPAIFKFVSMSPDVPKDFDKQKASRSKELRQSIAGNRIADEVLKQITSGSAAKWESSGYKAMFDWALARNDTTILYDKAKRRAAIQKAYEGAKQAVSEADALGEKQAKLAQYGAYEDLTKMLKGSELETLKKDRSKVVEDVLAVADSTELRLELAKYMLAKKDIAGALNHLEIAAGQMFVYDDATIKRYEVLNGLRPQLAAAGATTAGLKKFDDAMNAYKTGAFGVIKDQVESNQDYSPSGQDLYTQYAATFDRIKALGFLTPDQIKVIEKGLNDWKVGKAKSDKENAEMLKKKQEEDKKKLEEQKKNPSSPSSTGAPANPGVGDFGVPKQNTSGTQAAPKDGKSGDAGRPAPKSGSAGKGASAKTPAKTGGR